MNDKEMVELAENELTEEENRKKKDLIKRVIKQTLTKIEEKTKKRNELNNEIKVLKQDIDNIKKGRLDLIAERQEIDLKAKDVSVIEVIKEVHHHYHNYWYEPYGITIKEYDYDFGWNCVNCESNTFSFEANNSTAKFASVGTYELSNGKCITIN